MSEATLTRRSFLKLTALAGATAAIGSSLSGLMVETAAAEEVKATIAGEEYVKMRTSCHGCIQMCPAIAYLKDGVVVKLEGDPDAPVSRGSLCIKGLNQLNTMYSPRRVLHPLRRAGERGENKWEVISWDDAIDEAAQHIHDSIEQYGNYSFMASVGGGGSYSFLQAMTLPMGMGSPTVIEPGCAQCYLPRVSVAAFMGVANQSIADNAVQEIFRLDPDNKSEVVVLWAAQPSVSQSAESGRGMAELRASGVKTIVVDPNFSPDAVHADIWLPVRPATDTGLLLCWLRYIFENKLYNEQFTKYWTNLPFLIDPDTKLPVLASELFPDFKQTTPDNTPAYCCYDNKTGKVAPFEYSAPEDATVDPEIFWSGDYDGKTYTTAGQIYKDQADPWTLDYTAENCWLQADQIEAAIRMYAHADDDGTVSGIANGVASDMTESSSQVPLGCMALDSIMGYVNIPGATITLKNNNPTTRPVTKLSFSDDFGIAAVIGMSDEENKARSADLAKTTQQELANQILYDRLGMKDHKGLYHWNHSHIPTVRNAIATGEPYKPRVWFDMSGNKLAMLGNATSWYDVIPELDFIICQYPMLTSFQVEAADIVFPVREWLEEPMQNMTQLNTKWLQNECVHIGETVSHSIPAYQVIHKVAEKFGGQIPNALYKPGSDGKEPFYNGQGTEAEVKQSVADALQADSWDELIANTDKYVPCVIPADQYFTYNQQDVIVDDGLPAGFPTESRKIEVYCQMLLKLARTGYPFCYPKPQEACDDYSPICEYIEPAESPLADEEYPFVLTSGRVHYFHHGTMRHAAFSRELFPCAEIRINPASAKELGIEHMDWVKVTSRRGSVHARAYLTEGVNPKTVWMERFWNPECFDESQPNPDGGWQECNVNVLTKNDAPFNEVYGSYTNRGFTVKIEKSEKPDNIWVEPEEFAPFLPSDEMKAEPQTGDVF